MRKSQFIDLTTAPSRRLQVTSYKSQVIGRKLQAAGFTVDCSLKLAACLLVPLFPCHPFTLPSCHRATASLSRLLPWRRLDQALGSGEQLGQADRAACRDI